MGFPFISVYKNIHHGFNHSEVNNSYSAVLMQLHQNQTLPGHTQRSRQWLSVARQQDLPHGGINPLNPELNPICYLLALLGAHHFLHFSRIRVKLLTFRLLMSYIYIYMEHPFLMFLDHTQRRSTVGRTPLDE